MRRLTQVQAMRIGSRWAAFVLLGVAAALLLPALPIWRIVIAMFLVTVVLSVLLQPFFAAVHARLAAIQLATAVKALQPIESWPLPTIQVLSLAIRYMRLHGPELAHPGDRAMLDALQEIFDHERLRRMKDDRTATQGAKN